MLSRLSQEFFQASQLLALPLLALVLFLVVFAGITIRALRTPAAEIDHMGRLPLDEKKEGERK